MALPTYVKEGWGSYNDLISMTMKDFIEIKVGIDSRKQEEQISNALGG